MDLWILYSLLTVDEKSFYLFKEEEEEGTEMNSTVLLEQGGCSYAKGGCRPFSLKHCTFSELMAAKRSSALFF